MAAKNKNNKIDAVISKEGYIINKKNISLSDLSALKDELYITPDIPEEFSKDIKPYPIYKETDENITIPRYYGVDKFGDVKKQFKPVKTSFDFNGTLRPYQKEILDEVLPKIVGRGGGLISLPCGRGKTILAIKIAHELKVKTLVLVHKTFLQDQWIDRTKAFTNAKIGTIRQSHVDIQDKDIVIGMIQSISMRSYDSSIFDEFGLVIVDECHHIASRVFSRALRKTGAMFTIGLSATPKRIDGLTKVITWYLGRMLYQEERCSNNNVVVRKFNINLDDPLFALKTQWCPPPKNKIPAVPKMITNLCQINRRNKIILNTINAIRKNPKRKILVLSGRISHLEFLKSEIDKKIEIDVENGVLLKDECKTCFYMGKLSQEERKYTETYGDIIFASYELANEGLDIERLNTIILSTPKKNVIQAIGRIMRKILSSSDIKPLIVDICDRLSIFTYQGETRYKLYKTNKYSIKEFVCDNKYQTEQTGDYDTLITKENNVKFREIFDEDELDKIIIPTKEKSKIVKFSHEDYSECLFDD